MRFFANRQQIYDGASPLTIATPYAENDLLELQHKQVNDEVRITHPKYPPYKLRRLGEASWEISVIEFDAPPLLDENLTDVTIAASAVTGTAIDLIASDDIFEDGHIGAYFRIGHKVPAQAEKEAIDGDGNGTALPILGTFVLRTSGTWTADVIVERSEDGTTEWEPIVVVTSADDRNVNQEIEATTLAYYRIVIDNYVSNTDGLAVIEAPETVIYGYVKIIDVGSPGAATADVTRDLYSTDATVLWSEGAFSTVRGYPRACALHESRLIYGGTTNDPQTLWGSVIDDFDNFEKGLTAADSWTYQLASEQLNTIQWILSHRYLFVGTTGSEFVVRGDAYGATIVPTTPPDVKQHSRYGSDYMPAIICDGNVLFVERKGRIVNELIYNSTTEQFEATQLTLMAEHITESGIVQMAWQSDKRILWAVRTDGTLIGLTYNKAQKVIGWHRHETDGVVESVSVIYGDHDSEDEVWLVVARDVGTSLVLLSEDESIEYASGAYVSLGTNIAVPATPSLTFQIKNTSIIPIVLGDIELATDFDSTSFRSGFSITTNPTGNTVQPGATEEVTVGFTGTQTGSYAMRLDVFHDDIAEPFSLFMVATATAGGT
jgi:hypothetical protein